MVTSSLPESTHKYRRELDYDSLEMAVHCVSAAMTHANHISTLLRREFGPEKGFEIYHAVIDKLMDPYVPAVAAAIGVKEVKDIPALGRLVEVGLTAFPTLYETVTNTKDLHIGHLPWCIGCGYGSKLHPYESHTFFRGEVGITIDPFLTAFVKWAKAHGLEEDVEIDVPVARCTNASAHYCVYVLKRKGAPEPEIPPPAFLPPGDESLIEFEMGDEEPLAYILKKQGRTVEDQLPSSFLGYFLYDISAYDGFEEKLGKERALELYRKLWLTYLADWTKEARLELEIGKVANLEDLAKIITFCQKKKFTSYQTVSKGNNQTTLSGTNDPFAEMSTKFTGKEIGSNYLKAVVSANEEFINQIAREVKMGDAVKVTVKKALAKGDDKNEILIERR